MTPPGGIPKHDYSRPLTPGLEKAIPSNCTDESCMNAELGEGVHRLQQGDKTGAQDIFQNMVHCAAATENIRYEVLARALVDLSQGHIIAAQSNLEAIKDNPYANQLLRVISHYDDQVIHLQTLYILNNLTQEEKADHPDQASFDKIQNFLEEAIQILSSEKNTSIEYVFKKLEEDPNKNFSGMTESVKRLGNGLGSEILHSMGLSNNLRAQTLFQMIDNKLIPQKRMGTAFLIAKMYQKDPVFGSRANHYLLKCEGIIKDPRWISTDFLDQGATYFAISLLSMGIARYSSRAVWAYLTRNNQELSFWKRIAGAGISLGVSTTTYFVSEKALLSLTGFDGKIFPSSGSELAKELGADMIVMGLSNLMGGAFTWSTDRIFRPISTKIPWPLRYAGYTLRSPIRAGVWGLTSFAHASVLYGVHRWEDNIGMIDRFRKGKPQHLLPQNWIDTEHDALHVIQAQNNLREYLSNASGQTQNIKGDQMYHQIHDMNRWIRNLNDQNPNNLEQNDKLLGIFWMARTCGSLNESAQDYLVKWMKDKRYDKVNDYLYLHKIPIKVNEEGKFILPNTPFPFQQAPSFK